MDLDEKLTGCSWRVRSSGSELGNRSSKCLSHFKQRKVGWTTPKASLPKIKEAMEVGMNENEWLCSWRSVECGRPLGSARGDRLIVQPFWCFSHQAVISLTCHLGIAVCRAGRLLHEKRDFAGTPSHEKVVFYKNMHFTGRLIGWSVGTWSISW